MVREAQDPSASRASVLLKASPAPRTWGKESVLCPRSFTTVSEELEVEELISFTISPAQRGEEDVMVISRLLSSLGIHACCPCRLALALWQKHPQLHRKPSPQQLHLYPMLSIKHPKFARKWHTKLSPGSLAPQRPPSSSQHRTGNTGNSLGTALEKPGSHL